MDELRFDPPIRLNRDVPISLPHQITTRPEASAVIAMLPTCGIRWCGRGGLLGDHNGHDEVEARTRHRT
jgi:hypothetical protein